MGTLTTTAAAIAYSAAAWLLLVQPVAAQAEYGARAEVDPPRIARSGEDATGATTRVELSRRTAPLESAADVFAEVPGARVLQAGGYGAFSTVSLRGNEPAHTTWLLGEAPLNNPESGGFDASLLPLVHFSRLDVHRGGAPLWLSQGAIAGAVRLLPRDEPSTGYEARLGGGSFGLRQGLLAAHVRPRSTPRLSWFTSAQLVHNDGDFPYLDDRATRFDPSDDRELRLRNADVTDGSGLSHLRAPLAGGELDAVAFGIRRLGGVPGAAGLGSNALQTRRGLLSSALALAYTHRGETRGGRGYRVQLAASARCTSTQLHDPLGELGAGGPRHTSDTRLHGFGRLAASHELLRFLELTAVASHARAGGDREDELRRSPLGAHARATVAGALELRLFGAPLALPSELRASARLEHTHIEADVFERGRARHDDHDNPGRAFRASAAAEPWPFLTLRGSAGTGTRSPSADELFGDGATIRPNTSLVPERGRYADAGLVFSHKGPWLEAGAELTAFVQDVDDRIIFVVTNEFEARARNVASAEIRGLEAGVDAELRSGTRLVGSATLLDTRNQFGRRLPLRPRLRAYGQLEQSLRLRRVWAERLTGFVEVEHEASAFYDPANEVLRSPLTKVGGGVLLALARERVELAARVSDVFDARGQDYLRFPLPGRSFFFLATFREAMP